MNDGAKPEPHRFATSARIVIEGLAVVGICWLANSVQQQNSSIVRLQVQVTALQASLADVPRLSHDLAQAQIMIAEHGRRIDRIEDGSDNPKLRGWTR